MSWSPLRVVLAFVPLGVVLLYVGDHHYDAEITASAHTFNDDLGAGPLFALFALAALMLVGGNAAVTLARDIAMIALAAMLVAVIVPHAHMVVSPHDDNRWMRVPVLGLLAIMVVQLAIDLVLLQPVFAALRARRLPRATVRRRRRRA